MIARIAVRQSVKCRTPINAIEVVPNHVDDYLTGLRSSQVSAFEVLKRRGLIDDYKFMVRTGYVKGSPNVIIMNHVPITALDGRTRRAAKRSKRKSTRSSARKKASRP